jgi:hypothetical protein
MRKNDLGLILAMVGRFEGHDQEKSTSLFKTVHHMT